MKRKADTQLGVSSTWKKRKRDSTVPVTAVDKRLARRIKRLEDDVEIKYSDTYQAYTTLPVETTPAWNINCLNTAVLGTSQVNQRVGTQTINKSLEIRMSVASQTANIVDNRVRIVVFFYKNSNTLLPVPGQLFDLSTGAGAPSFAHYNEQYKDSFEVLYDRTIELKPLDWDGTTTTIGDQISINKRISLKNRRSRFVIGAGAGTYADLVDNGLFMAIMTSANSGAAGVNNPRALISTRCFFTDS